MKYILVILLFSLTCNAELISAIGQAEPSYSNLDYAINDAKNNSLNIYIQKHYYDAYTCLDETLDLDKDDYTIELIREINLSLTPKHLFVEAEFDVHAITLLKNKLEQRCKAKQASKKRWIAIGKFFDNLKPNKSLYSWNETYNHYFEYLHVNGGLYAWAETYGVESSISYETYFISFYLVGAYQTLDSSGDSEVSTPETLRSDAITLGFEVALPIPRLFKPTASEVGLLFGYDFYVNQSDHEKVSKKASAATVWGLYYKTASKTWDFGFIFKHYNDINQNNKSFFSGGLRVRYKFI